MSDEIKIKHPSKCYSCEHARKTCSDELQSEGYTGCCILLYGNKPFEKTYNGSEVKVGETIGTGWIQPKVRPFGDIKNYWAGSSVNCQLITREITECTAYQKISD